MGSMGGREGDALRGETLKRGRDGLEAEASTSAMAFDGVEDFDMHSSRRSWWRRLTTALRRQFFSGLQPSPELYAVALGYFVQGVKTRMAILAEKYLMKDVLLMSPSKAEVWLEIAHLPWITKPLYGFVSDTFPIMGERRRPYLVICGCLGCAAYLGLAGLSQSPGVAVVFMTLAEGSIAFSDVVVDGIVVEKSRNEPLATAGSLQSICWGSQAVGSLVSAWSAGWLVQKAGPRFVILVMAVFPLLISMTALLIRPPPKQHDDSSEQGDEVEAQKLMDDGNNAQEDAGSSSLAAVRSQLKELWDTLLSRPIFLPVLFTFVWSAAPLYGSAMFYFYSNYLAFTPEFIGRIELLDGIAQLAGVVVFNLWLKNVPLKTVFLWICLAGTTAGATQLVLVTGLNRTLGLSDKLFAAVDSVLIEGLTRVAMMPVLVLAARLCPVGIEATLYAALMSIQNAASSVGGLIGAGLTSVLGITATSFTAMPWLVGICTLLKLLPLCFLWMLPSNTALS